jgi:hypothetical protein
MMKSILKNNLYIMAALGFIVAIYIGTSWQTLPVLQRMSGLFLVGLVLHLSEEGRFPGGFVELITENLQFTASSRWFGEVVTAAYVQILSFAPLFFPRHDQNVSAEAPLLPRSGDGSIRPLPDLALHVPLCDREQSDAPHMVAVLVPLHAVRVDGGTADRHPGKRRQICGLLEKRAAALAARN